MVVVVDEKPTRDQMVDEGIEGGVVKGVVAEPDEVIKREGGPEDGGGVEETACRFREDIEVACDGLMEGGRQAGIGAGGRRSKAPAAAVVALNTLLITQGPEPLEQVKGVASSGEVEVVGEGVVDGVIAEDGACQDGLLASVQGLQREGGAAGFIVSEGAQGLQRMGGTEGVGAAGENDQDGVEAETVEEVAKGFAGRRVGVCIVSEDHEGLHSGEASEGLGETFNTRAACLVDGGWGDVRVVGEGAKQGEVCVEGWEEVVDAGWAVALDEVLAAIFKGFGESLQRGREAGAVAESGANHARAGAAEGAIQRVNEWCFAHAGCAFDQDEMGTLVFADLEGEVAKGAEFGATR